MRRLTDDVAVVLLALTLLLTAQTVLRAANLEEAIAHFTADDYSETDAGIGAVAASGDPCSASLIGGGLLQRRAEEEIGAHIVDLRQRHPGDAGDAGAESEGQGVDPAGADAHGRGSMASRAKNTASEKQMILVGDGEMADLKGGDHRGASENRPDR